MGSNFLLAFWLVRIVRGFHVNGDTGTLRATSRAPLPFKRTCHFNIITLVIANHSFNRGGFAGKKAHRSIFYQIEGRGREAAKYEGKSVVRLRSH